MGCRAFALRGCLWRRWCSGRRRARPLCVPVGGGPPASRPCCELRSARRLEARPGPAAAHRHRGRSLRRPPRQWGLVADAWFGVLARSPARPRRRPPALQPGPPQLRVCVQLLLAVWLRPSPISHVIPPQLFQILNSDRWNCNVCGRSPKVTVGNYVRLLSSPGPSAF